MDLFAHTSYKHQRDQQLLARLSAAILVLKIQAQRRLSDYQLTSKDVDEKRVDLARFLESLDVRVRLVDEEDTGEKVDLAFTGLAERFIKYNPADVEDRLREYSAIRKHLLGNQPLSEIEFRFLDRLHSLLEEEVSEVVRSLYRF